MAQLSPTLLLGMDYTYMGQPFVQAVPTASMITRGMEYTYRATPFVTNEDINEIPYLYSKDTFLAPAYYPLIIHVPHLTDRDIFNNPRWFPLEKKVEGSISTLDTFYGPASIKWSGSANVPTVSDADTFLVPTFSFTVFVYPPALYSPDFFIKPSFSGESILKHIFFPNTTGRHITIKIRGNTLYDGLDLSAMRLLMHVSHLQDSHIFPNTESGHVTVKIQNNELSEPFLIDYMGLLMHAYNLQNTEIFPDTEGNRVTLKIQSDFVSSSLQLDYMAMNIHGGILS